MFLHVVLARFRADADPADVDRFVRLAESALANAPFAVRAVGPDLQLGITNAASWGYVAEVADPSQLEQWEQHRDHLELRDAMLRIRESVLNVQIPAVSASAGRDVPS
jgi:hypothetical protein